MPSAVYFNSRRRQLVSTAGATPVPLLPFLQQLSSASSLWTVSFISLFFSFSFSYFFFHCSAVSSRFTDTVFLMVLALIGGMWRETERREKRGERERIGRGREGAERRNVWIVKKKRLEIAANMEKDCQHGDFSLCCSMKMGLIPLITMQIGFLQTVFYGAWKRKNIYIYILCI